MKIITAGLISLFFAIALIGTPPVSFAQNSGATTGKPSSVLDRIRERIKEKKSRDDGANQWFENLDTNKDDEITKQELFENLRGRFDKLDLDRDGAVSKSEYLRLRKDRQSGDRRFGELDSNADGRLTLPEFATPADWRFDRIDRNLDGKLSRTEAERLLDRPVGDGNANDLGECFYVDRQIVRVKGEVAETYKKRGYPKTDCNWTPDVIEQEKTKKY